MEDNPHIAINDIDLKLLLSLAKSNILKILKDRTKWQVSSPIKHRSSTDNFTKTAIRGKMHAFYLHNEIPTMDKILSAVNDDSETDNFNKLTMYRF